MPDLEKKDLTKLRPLQPPSWGQNPAAAEKELPKTNVIDPASAEQWVAQLGSESRYQAEKTIHRLRKAESARTQVQRDLDSEIGAGLGRGTLQLGKLPFSVAKILGSDVLGIDAIRHSVEPILWKFEEWAESPELKPGVKAGGKPIELDRAIESPGEVAKQIVDNVTNPHFWASQLPEAAMSMLPFFGGNVAARLGAKALFLGKALEAAKAAGDVEAIVQIGVRLARIGKMGGYGAAIAMEAAGAEERLRNYELTQNKPVEWGPRVFSILGTGIIAGSLEAISLGRIFSGKAGSNLAYKILESVATEGSTEGAQELVANAFQKIGYDPDQKLTEGVVESVLIGGALGGMAGGVEVTREHIGNLLEGQRLEQARQARQEPAGQIADSMAQGMGQEPVRKPTYRTGPPLGEATRQFIPIPGAALPAVTPPMRPTPPAAPPAPGITQEEINAQLGETGGFGPLPPAFGGPPPSIGPVVRPKPIVTDLMDRVAMLKQEVDETGDPAAAQELNQLIDANRELVRDLISVPEVDRSALEPIAARLLELYERVDETGDPVAARELNRLIADNAEYLQGLARWQLRKIAGQELMPPAAPPPVEPTPPAAPPPVEPTPPAAPPAPTVEPGGLPEQKEEEEYYNNLRDALGKNWEQQGIHLEGDELDRQVIANLLKDYELLSEFEEDIPGRFTSEGIELTEGLRNHIIGLIKEKPELSPFAPTPEEKRISEIEQTTPAEIPEGGAHGLTTDELAGYGYQKPSAARGSLPTFKTFPVERLQIRPDIFQIKRGYEPETGLVQERGGEPYYERRAGEISVFRSPEGDFILAHGHHRYNWATAEGIPTVNIKVYDSADGWTVETVKDEAALENIADGKLDPLDIATFLRGREFTPDTLKEKGVDLRLKPVQTAIGLSGLIDQIFDDVYSGRFAEDKAAVIGKGLAGQPEAQNAFYQYLSKKESEGQEVSAKLIESMIQLGQSAPTIDRKQVDLFGEKHIAESLLLEKAELVAAKTEELKQSKRIFGFANKAAKRLQEAGNILDEEANKLVAELSKRGLEIFQKASGLVDTAVSKVLNEYAVKLSEVKTLKERNDVKREAADALDTAIADDYRTWFGQEIGGGPAEVATEGRPKETPSETAKPELTLEEKIAIVKRALPDLDEAQATILAQDDELFVKVAQGNLSAILNEKIKKKLGGVTTGQKPLIEGEEGPSVDLFGNVDVKPQPKPKVPKAPPPTIPGATPPVEKPSGIGPKPIFDKLRATKVGNAVGFTENGETVTISYRQPSKSWDVKVYNKNGATSLTDPRNKSFPTVEEAKEYAATLLNYKKTKELAWWDISDQWELPSEPGEKVPLPPESEAESFEEYQKRWFKYVQAVAEDAQEYLATNEELWIPSSQKWLRVVNASGIRVANKELQIYDGEWLTLTQDQVRSLAQQISMKPFEDKVAPSLSPRPAPPSVPGAKPPISPGKEAESSHTKLASDITAMLDKGESIAARQLFEMADRAYGGTQAEGKYTPKDAYDAMELGINQHIAKKWKKYDPRGEAPIYTEQVLTRCQQLMEMVPTQTRRTNEQDEFQQFSTPPALAYVVNWTANINPDDVVLEPSAGVGGLAVFAKNAGAKKVVVNELSARRAELLRAMKFDEVYTENAEHLASILPKSVKPTVVVMNPPFSATAGRIPGARKTIYGARHIEQALQKLEPGGRLVAIVGTGMAPDKPAFREWWKEIKDKYNVRANIGVSGKNYYKYGTTFDNRVIVIDNNGRTQGEVITGEIGNLAEMINLLQEVRNERVRTDTGVKQKAPQPVGKEGPESGEGGGGPGLSTPTPTPIMGPGEQEGEDVGGTTGPHGVPPSHGGGHGGVEPEGGNAGVRAEQPGGRGVVSGTEGSGGSGVRPTRPTTQPISGSVPGVSVEVKKAEKPKGDLTDSIYEDYHPQRLKIPDAKPHPGQLKESAAMAAVLPPAPTYQPKLSQEVITSGRLSDVQLEGIVYAGQAHNEVLPDGSRQGFMIGDGTGVGKGREIAGIVWDNYNQGRKKAVWISATSGLFKSARRDVEGVGWNPDLVMELRKIKYGSTPQKDEGIMFCSYDTLKSRQKEEGGQSRIDQVVKWLGEDFDGVIAFDESHKMGNAVLIQEGMRIKEPSARALAGLELQRRLPNARIVYVSATGATEVENLGYATRLGLWGDETPFPDNMEFFTQIRAGGLAAMELVARDLKAQGKYLARSLSYDDTTSDRLEHQLSSEQVEIYNEMARAWQIVLQNVRAALGETGQATNGRALSAALSAFWSAHQRFFNQIITSMLMPSVINYMKQDLKDGSAPVIQLVNTNEAAQERALAGMEEDGTLEELDLTPRESLMQYVERSFPTQQYEDYEDENGNIKSRPVVDSNGDLVHNEEALRMKEELLDRLGVLRVPEGPLEMMINHFGPNIVAEVTGRKRRIVRHGGKSELEKRSNSKVEQDIEAFLNDKKKILIFSDKGGTGRSYHADNTIPNQRKRRHYLVQAGWRADNAIQGFGRTHRSNQASAPDYILCTTNLRGHSRFISSIARRLDQLGAMTKGQRQTGSNTLFQAKDNLESTQARDGLQRFFVALYHGEVEGLSLNTFEEQTGLKLTTPEGGLKQDLPPITQFLNRLLSMEVEAQNKTFDAFMKYVDDAVEDAARLGTLDVGMQTLRPDPGGRIEKIGEPRTVYTDPKTGAETKYVQIAEINPTKFRNFDELVGKKYGFVQNKRSGRVWARSARTLTRTDIQGNVYRVVLLEGPNINSIQTVEEYTFWDRSRWTLLDQKEARILWEKEIAQAPRESTVNHHLITGVILPVWDRLGGATNVMRVQTEDGERFIGRKIDSGLLNETLANLGTSGEEIKLTPDEVHNNVLELDWVIGLANQWGIKRSRVQGEERIEITGVDAAHMEQLRSYGVFTERISWQTRFFIPTSEDGIAVIERIIKTRPIVSAAPRKRDAGTVQYRAPRTPEPEIDNITPDLIKQRFGNAKVTQSGNSYLIELPNGKLIGLLLEQEMVKPPYEKLRAAHGPQLTRERYDEVTRAAGEWRPMTAGGVIALAKGESRVSLDHEIFHAACDLMLTEKELATILDKYGNWEDAAVAYEDWHPDKEPNGVWAKILHFFKRLANLLGADPTENIFNTIRSGQVWLRTETGTGIDKLWNQQKWYRVQKGGPQEVIDSYREKMIALPGKEKASLIDRIKNKKTEFREVIDTMYSQVVDRWAAFERREQRAIEAGVVVPAGERTAWTLSAMRGYEGRVQQGITGDAVYHDVQEFDDNYDDLVFTGQELKKVGPSLVKCLEPLQKVADRQGNSFTQVASDLFHVLMPAQRDIELAGEFGNRGPDQIKGVDPILSRQVIKALTQKYGTDMGALRQVAVEVRNWGDQMILQPLLQAGILDQTQYDAITQANQYYVPYLRLLDDLNQYVDANAKSAGMSKVIHKIEGSERQKLDPLQMWIELAYKAQFAYARNRVYRSLYVYSQYGNLNDVKEVQAKYIPLNVTLKQEIDGGLRPEIEQLARDLKISVKTLYALGRNTLGRFKAGLAAVPGIGVQERKEIELRFATSEKTLAHELGHAIDHDYGLVDLLIKQGTPQMKRELRAIADQRMGPGASNYYRRYVRKLPEQVAEFVCRYITERNVCRSVAPEATRVLEKFIRITPQLLPLLNFKPTAQANLREFYHRMWARSPLPPEPGCLPYYRDGRMRWLKVPPDIYAAAVNMMPGDIGVLMKIAKYPADLLRAGAVLVPEFALARNPVRDIVQSWMFSQYGFNPADWFRTTWKVLTKDAEIKELQRQWEAGGGVLATLAQSFAQTDKITADQITGDNKKYKYFPHPVKALRYVSTYLENLTRFAIYKQAREAGASHAAAIHEARRTTLDYSRVGGHPAVRYLGMIIPFFNASIQGMDKLYTELTGPNRKTVGLRLAMLTTASIGLFLLASRDDRYKEIEDWEKNYFWHVPLGDKGPMIRIPKPFEAGIIFGSIPERMIEWGLGQNPGGVQSALKAAWEGAMPEIVPTIARPIVEFQANYDFFRGSPIEDEALRRLPLAMRAKPWTMEISKAFSKHFGEPIGISPVEFEHFVRTWAGGLGANYALPFVDVVLRKAGVLEDIPKPERDAIQKVWGVRAFFSRTPTGYRAKSVGDFFENYQAAIQADQGWKILWQTGKMKELDRYLKAHPEAMYARVARKAVAAMSELKKERNNIYLNPTMSSSEKQERLEKLDDMTLAIAQKANRFMNLEMAKKIGMPGRGRHDMNTYYEIVVRGIDKAYQLFGGKEIQDVDLLQRTVQQGQIGVRRKVSSRGQRSRSRNILDLPSLPAINLRRITTIPGANLNRF